jgi:peroxiredoxin
MIFCAISLGAVSSAFCGVAQPQDTPVRPTAPKATLSLPGNLPVADPSSLDDLGDDARVGRKPLGAAAVAARRGGLSAADPAVGPAAGRLVFDSAERGHAVVRSTEGPGAGRSGADAAPNDHLRWSERVAAARAGRIEARVAQARVQHLLSQAAMAVAHAADELGFGGVFGSSGAGSSPISLDRSHFLRLSESGDLRATVQLLFHPELLATTNAWQAERGVIVPGAPERELRRALYLRLVAQAPYAADLETFEVLEQIDLDVATGWLKPTGAVDALRAIELVHGSEPLGRRAKLARAVTIIGMGAGPNFDRADAAAARLLAALVDAPEADIAREASDRLWRLLHLRAGRPAPPLCGNDPDGNEICLADLHGRVVLLSFWSLDDADAADLLQRDAAFVERYWDHPFAVFGVNRDPDRASFLRVAEEYGLPGNQVYDGPLAPNLSPEISDRRAQRPNAFEAWREGSTGSQYLIDSNGFIRAVDLSPELLPEFIQGLIDEHYRETRRRGF